MQEFTLTESEAHKEGYKTISKVAKERICCAVEKVKSEIKEDLFTQQGKPLNISFWVFKLDCSNINAWDGKVQNFEANLLTATENIKHDHIEENTLYEIRLKSGLNLAQSVEEKKYFVFIIACCCFKELNSYSFFAFLQAFIKRYNTTGLTK